MKKEIKIFIDDLTNFSIFDKLFNISFANVSFLENLHIDINNRLFTLKFYRNYKNVLYFVEISKSKIEIQKNIKTYDKSLKTYIYLYKSKKIINFDEI